MAADPLAHRPFGWRPAGANRLELTFDRRVVTVLRGAAATRARARLDAAVDEATEQQVLGRLTGNFKRGNER